MLAVTVIQNTVTKRLWNFQIRFLPYSNAFEKIFLPNFYHFLQLCPRGHISKMLAVTVLKNTVTKRLCRMRLEFFSKHVLLSFSSTLSPRSYPKMLALTVIKNTVTKRLWNFQMPFPAYSNAFEKKMFFIIFFNIVPEVISRECLL